MDERLDKFIYRTDLHEKVVWHLHEKRCKHEEIEPFKHAETWLLYGTMIQMGVYQFDPLIEGYIDKRTGKGMSYKQAKCRNFEDVRMIYMFTTRDRAIAHMLYLIYYEECEKDISDLCVSYKKGISTSNVNEDLSNLIVATGWDEGWKMDIHHYFDDVTIQAIEKQLKKMDNGSCLDKLLWELYHDDRVLVNNKLVHRHRGLIQGCAFACLLADLILKYIDDAISQKRVIYYRYSDDIIVLGPDADKAKYKIGQMLKKVGLELHPNKVKRIKKGEWFEFLGGKIKADKRSVSKDTLKEIEHNVSMKSISIVRERKTPATEAEVRKMIRSIQSYLFTAYARDAKNFGMGVYLFNSVNIPHDIKAIDKRIKDCLRACLTGNTVIPGLGSVDRTNYAVCYGIENGFHPCNVEGNRIKTGEGTDDDKLIELGWISLSYLYDLFHNDKDMFSFMINQMMNGTPVTINI